jgi:hypothetical protein
LGQCVGGRVIHFPAGVCTSSPSTTTSLKANTSREPKIGLLLAHPVSQGALVTIWLLCALSVTEPPHRAVMRLALPYLSVVAVLLSLAVTELKPPAAAAA